MDSFMDKFWSFIGLASKLDESGEGYEPSTFSRLLAVPSKSDYKPIGFDKIYNGKKKILVICCEERYMEMGNGKKFSTGNHPVELIHPLLHVTNANFEYDVATPTGKPPIIEEWALPTKDQVVLDFYNTNFKLKETKSLVELVKENGKLMEDYIAIYLPGGHGAMLGLPTNENMGKVLDYTKLWDIHVISVCHGPAMLLASKDAYKNYKIACFPDSIDQQTPIIGYLPGTMPWYFGQKLIEELNIEIMNTSPDDTVIVDRKLITGASPKACQELGKVVTETLLEQYA